MSWNRIWAQGLRLARSHTSKKPCVPYEPQSRWSYHKSHVLDIAASIFKGKLRGHNSEVPCNCFEIDEMTDPVLMTMSYSPQTPSHCEFGVCAEREGSSWGSTAAGACAREGQSSATAILPAQLGAHSIHQLQKEFSDMTQVATYWTTIIASHYNHIHHFWNCIYSENI